MYIVSSHYYTGSLENEMNILFTSYEKAYKWISSFYPDAQYVSNNNYDFYEDYWVYKHPSCGWIIIKIEYLTVME